MPRQLTSEQIAIVMANRQLPVRDIARLAGCSVGMVSKILNAAPQAAQEEAGEPDAGDAVEIAEQLVASDGTSESELRASLARLQKAGRVAEANKDVARMVGVERVTMQILALLERMKPEPVDDPNDAPDMIEAARSFRERAHGLLDRILAGVPK
jgi:hypothetical protein